MFARLLWPALGAGCAAGLVLAVLQVLLTTPIILHAEVYENAGLQVPSLMPASYTATEQAPVVLAHGGAHDESATWAPADGVERMLYSSLAAVLTGIGFALLLVAGMALKGAPFTAHSGLAWGAAGFVAVALAPALGLPPELPGSAYADLVSRQIWWMGTAVATAAGLAAILLSGSRLWVAAGIALIALPHIVGAPHAGGYTSTAPAELAGHFAAASLATSAVFWAVLGSVAGALMQRMHGPQQSA